MHNKKIVVSLWLGILIIIGIYYIYNPYFFSQEGFNEFLVNSGNYILPIFLIISIIRGFLFIPSTLLIFAGALFITPGLLFITAMVGIIISSSLVYYFSEYLGIDNLLINRFGKKKIEFLEKKINNNGFLIVSLWSFSPFVPTDLICYVAGTTNMRYFKFISGLIVGELPLVLFYVLVANGIFNMI